jgi:hypothetical protein
LLLLPVSRSEFPDRRDHHFIAGFLTLRASGRQQNLVTAFGAFYDSTLDRYADMALYMGLLVYYR